MVGYAGLITQFSKREIDQLFKDSKRIVNNDKITILAAPRSKDFARILIVTPKAIGGAVKRNLLKRRLKSIFYQEKLYELLNYDLVTIARKPLLGLSFQETKELLQKGTKKLS